MANGAILWILDYSAINIGRMLNVAFNYAKMI